MADDLDRMLAEAYGETHGRGDSPSFLPLAPLRPPAEARSYPRTDFQRPEAVTAPAERGAAHGLYGVARTPYDLGRIPTEAVFNATHGQYGPAALNALELAALFGPRARIPNFRPQVREWPVEAALKFGDKHIFTGESHYDALQKAQQHLGMGPVESMLNTAGDGFITNTGRYVTREEAGALADALNNTRHYANKKGKEGFIAEALDAYDPKTGREVANPLDVMGLYEGK